LLKSCLLGLGRRLLGEEGGDDGAARASIARTGKPGRHYQLLQTMPDLLALVLLALIVAAILPVMCVVWWFGGEK